MAAEVEFSVEAAVKELRNVSWPMLLLALDVDQEKETQIANECRGNDEKAISQLLRHWHDNHDSSWEKLAEALMSLPPFRRRGAYLYNKYVNPQCFTAEKIADELRFVEDWFQLAHPFLDESDQIRTAVADTPEAERRLKVIKTWLEDYYDVPSWDEVANIVEDCFPEYEAVGEQLRKKYLPEVTLLNPGQRKQSPLEDLSSKTAFTETSDITDWYALGWFLGIAEVDLLEIDDSHSRTDEKRQAVLDKWLELEGDATNWMALSRAISKMRPHHGLSRRLKERAQKKELVATTVESTETKDTATEETQDIKIESEVSETQQKNPVFQNLRAQAESLIDDIGAIQITVKRLANDSNEKQIQGVEASLEQVKADLGEMKITFDQAPEEEGMQYEGEKGEPSEIETPSLKESLMMSAIISKTEGNFDSDEDYSLNWEKYGCRLHIPRGSIIPGEKGKLKIYAIHNGPFKVPNELRLASAIYYVSISHDLLKPATLEIQHCSRNTGNATILYIPDTKSGGPPYEFETLEGGIFNTSDYCIIQRSTFSIYAVGSYIIDNIKSLFGFKSSPVQYGLFHLLIAKDVRTWKAEILLIEYLNAYREYFLKEQRNVVENDFTRITLTEDVITITVSGEDEAAEIIKWKGHSMKIVDEWEITSSTSSTEPLQLSPDDISENLPSKIRIDIVWICPRSNKPRRNKFRIHINGSAKPYSFPVTVPQPYKSLSFSSYGGGSTDLSSFDDGDEPENLQNSPKKSSFMKEVAAKVHCSSKEFGCQLLDDESMLEFEKCLKSEKGGYAEEFMLMFDIWEKKGENVTWRKIIEVLRIVKETKLRKNLLRKFNDAVFET